MVSKSQKLQDAWDMMHGDDDVEDEGMQEFDETPPIFLEFENMVRVARQNGQPVITLTLDLAEALIAEAQALIGEDIE